MKACFLEFLIYFVKSLIGSPCGGISLSQQLLTQIQPSDSLPWTAISARLWNEASHYLSSLYGYTLSALLSCCYICGHMLGWKLRYTQKIHQGNTWTHVQTSHVHMSTHTQLATFTCMQSTHNPHPNQTWLCERRMTVSATTWCLLHGNSSSKALCGNGHAKRPHDDDLMIMFVSQTNIIYAICAADMFLDSDVMIQYFWLCSCL